MWPSHKPKFEPLSSEQELTSKEKSPKVPSSPGSYLVISLLLDTAPDQRRRPEVIGIEVEPYAEE
jgi:hypothetical protein